MVMIPEPFKSEIIACTFLKEEPYLKTRLCNFLIGKDSLDKNTFNQVFIKVVEEGDSKKIIDFFNKSFFRSFWGTASGKDYPLSRS